MTTYSYTDPWQQAHNGTLLPKGQVWFPNPTREKSGTAALGFGFATGPNQTVAAITGNDSSKWGNGYADYDWLQKNVKQNVVGPDGSMGFTVSPDMVGGIGGSMVQTERSNTEYADHSKKGLGVLGVLALAAAIYTGGAAAGWWGTGAGAGSATSIAALDLSPEALSAIGTAGMDTTMAAIGSSAGLEGIASTAASALASGATLSDVVGSLTGSGLSGDALEEVVVSATKMAATSGVPITMGSTSVLAQAGLSDLSSLTGDSSILNSAGINPMDLSTVGTTAAGAVTEGGLWETIKSIATDPMTQNAIKLAGGLANYLALKGFSADQAKLAENLMNNADPYRGYIQSSVIPFMQGQQDLSKTLQGNAASTATQLSDLLKTNPLGGDYATYQGMLQKSYTDPLSVWNAPDMQALNTLFQNQIERRDAAAGRNSQYGARAVEMENNFLANALPQYRTGLNNAASTAGSAQNTAYSTQVQGLNSLYNNQATNATNAARNAIPNSNGTAGVAGAANASTQSNIANAASLTPIFDAVGSVIGYKQKG